MFNFPQKIGKSRDHKGVASTLKKTPPPGPRRPKGPRRKYVCLSEGFRLTEFYTSSSSPQCEEIHPGETPGMCVCLLPRGCLLLRWVFQNSGDRKIRWAAFLHRSALFTSLVGTTPPNPQSNSLTNSPAIVAHRSHGRWGSRRRRRWATTGVQ